MRIDVTKKQFIEQARSYNLSPRTNIVVKVTSSSYSTAKFLNYHNRAKEQVLVLLDYNSTKTIVPISSIIGISLKKSFNLISRDLIKYLHQPLLVVNSKNSLVNTLYNLHSRVLKGFSLIGEFSVVRLNRRYNLSFYIDKKKERIIILAYSLVLCRDKFFIEKLKYEVVIKKNDNKEYLLSEEHIINKEFYDKVVESTANVAKIFNLGFDYFSKVNWLGNNDLSLILSV